MLFYPQLATGALAQYPFVKQRIERTIQNIAQDGTVVSLYDIYAARIRWILNYQDLADAEAASIASFFQTCEGSLQPFLFLDPSANLLLYSQDLSQSAWVISSLLQRSISVPDPFGGTSATQVVNPTEAALNITQSVTIPGPYNCTMSVYLRCGGSPCTVVLSRADGSNSSSLSISPSSVWTRYFLSSTFASSQSNLSQFSLAVPGSANVDVFGFQVDAQPYPGLYLATTSTTSTYPNSRFDMNQLTIVSTAPSQNKLQVMITSQASA